ncbi:ATP-dependent nuclease [Burkholderia guangdongensis]|uniref:ATP-dependent nuclease n=1 Tax=Burkholderia guangdongensis TaxID=1792500 RepID=UPI0015CB54C5|nr:ATP-binding protein [Burkholderia guangdongensis]
MTFKSEIRDSTINGLLEKAATRNYGQYLAKLVLKHVRGFNNEPVSFDFPVTALIGPNGGGKTTILGAAGCAYKAISPKRFFAKSGKYDESMQDWAIEYEIIDRDLNKKDAIRRTTSFRNQRWNRDAPNRRVLVFGVSRTVPANERPELVRCASNSFNVPDAHIQQLAEPVRQAVSRILGKDVSGFSRMQVDSKGRVTLLAGRTKDGKGYSEFHFGAGESSVIRMVAEIELVEEQALVLIEEIENGLHPVATVRIVEYLIEVAERKKLQTIFTTHSNDALKPLPSKAIWVATQDRIFQGKLDIHSLRAITGQIEASLVIFVEDPFARLWVEAMLRQSGNIAVDHIQVHGMEGDGTAVAMNRYHRLDPSSKFPSICVIDGDSKQGESAEGGVFRLPGQSPESFVFDEVMSAWDSFGGKLSVALLQRFENADKVQQVCQSVRTTNMDPHLLFAQVGERLGLVPALTVAAAFANIWAQAYAEAVKQTLAPFLSYLPMEKAEVGA